MKLLNTFEIQAGEATEDLLQFMLQQVDDATLDQIEIEREHPEASGLASEPITIAATLIFLGHLAGSAATAGAAAAAGEAARRLTGLLWDQIAKWVKRTGEPVTITSGSRKVTITPQAIDIGAAEREFNTLVGIPPESPGLSSH